MRYRHTYEILVGNMKGIDRSEDLDVDGRIILKLVFQRNGIMWCGLDSAVS